MCDFAPRQGCDFSLAILQLTAAMAGLMKPTTRVVAASDNVMLLASDPTPVSTNPERDFPVEVPLIVADINRGGR